MPGIAGMLSGFAGACCMLGIEPWSIVIPLISPMPISAMLRSGRGRGRSIACAIFDEVAFWRDEASATPDKETYAAIRPGMAMLPGAMLIGISSPYRKVGLLYDKWREHYGKAGDVLVIRAPSRTMNPLLPQQVVDDA